MKIIFASLLLTFAACGSKQTPVSTTTTHTETHENGPDGEHKKVETDSSHVLNPDGSQVNETTTTVKSKSPGER